MALKVSLGYLCSEMFNRRATAFKPSLFSRVSLLIFCNRPPPLLPTSKNDWNLNDQFLFECVL